MAAKSLSGRKGTGCLDKEKLDYIKTHIQSRVPDKTSPLSSSSLFGPCKRLQHLLSSLNWYW